ncbi:MAG: UPF0104 family protein [Methanobrevibacter sp.]|nr:UPF0104 family protein [Methanobrevibacter sp.]
MKHKTLIFFVIGLAIMGVMLYFIGINEVIGAFKLANIWFVLLAIAMQILTYYLFAVRWNIVNKTADINVGIKELLAMTLVGMAINNTTPSGRVGGEPVKAYILSKKTDNLYEETFATVIADRALDTFPFILLAVMSIIAMILYFSLSTIVLLILIISVIVMTIAFTIVIYMSINEKAGEKIKKWIVKLIWFFYKKVSLEKLEERVIKAISGFQKTMNSMLHDKKILYYALPLSFIIWVTEILRVFLIFLAFGATVDPIIIGVVFIVASLVGMIPLLPGGLGAVDGFMIVFYSSAGIPPSISAAATLIERMISFGMTSTIGLVILSHYGSNILDKIKNKGINEEETAKEIVEELDYIEERDK